MSHGHQSGGQYYSKASGIYGGASGYYQGGRDKRGGEGKYAQEGTGTKKKGGNPDYGYGYSKVEEVKKSSQYHGQSRGGGTPGSGFYGGMEDPIGAGYSHAHYYPTIPPANVQPVNSKGKGVSGGRNNLF